MTNEEKLAKLLSEVGVSASFQKAWLEATDETETEVLEEIEAEVLKVTKATKLKDFKSKEDIDRDFKVAKGTLRAKVNKTLGMGLKRDATDAMDDDEFFKLVTEFYNSKISELSTITDEKVKEQSNTLKQEKIDLETALEKTTTEYENKIVEVKTDFEQRLHADQIEKVLIGETSKITYADEGFADLCKKDIQDFVLSNYKVLPDGSLQAKDGTTAIHPNGKATVSKVGEVVGYYADLKGYVKKSNGEPPITKNPIVDKKINDDELTPLAKEMAERFKAAGVPL